MFEQLDNRLLFTHDGEQVWIEHWGPNALRVRATRCFVMPLKPWALDEEPPHCQSQVDVTDPNKATIKNGKIKCTVSAGGKLTFSNDEGNTILEEYARNRRDILSKTCSALEVEAREFKPIRGGDYHLTARFESLDPMEKIYGMGQYQQPFLDLKGLDLELAQRNSQVSVPFALSSRGYGLLWNNPAIGRAVFGKNVMSFEAYSTDILDYWVVVGDTPSEIVQTYANITGKTPMMPEYGLGFWQCKLRYETQEELLRVAREYRQRALPLDLIVIDFFHWPMQGDWKFDPVFWPDPGKLLSCA